MRFLARRKFDEPEFSYNKLVEYFEYMEKYDFHNLTKERIIEQAQGKSKKIFDLGVHNFSGYDKQGRPIVILKISKIDKSVMNDMETARLYLLYQVNS